MSAWIRESQRAIDRMLLVAMAVVLSACSGGSGGSSDPVPPPASPAPPTANTPPTNVRLMEVSSMAAGQLSASWLPATDDTTPQAAMRYEVHASTEQGFTPSPATLRAQTTGTVSVVVTSGLELGQAHQVRLVAIDQQDARAVSAPLSVLIAETSGTPVPGVAIRALSAQEAPEVRPDSLVLAAGVAAPEVGAIVASAEGVGFLRRVTAVTNTAGQAVVSTERVALDEVVTGVQLSASVRMPAVTQSTPSGAPGQVQGLNVSQPAAGVTRFEWPEAAYTYEAGAVQTPGNRRSIQSANRGLSGLPTRVDISAPETASGSYMRVIAPTRINMETAAVAPILFTVSVPRDHDMSGVRNGAVSVCDVAVQEISGGNMASNSLALSAVEDGVLTPTLRDTSTDRVLTAEKRFNIIPGSNAQSEALYVIRFRATVQDVGDNCRATTQPGRQSAWRDQVDLLLYVLVNDNPFPSGEESNEEIQGIVEGSGSLTVNSSARISFDPVLSYGYANDDVYVIELEASPMIEQELSIRADLAGRFEKSAPFIQPRRFFKLVIAPGGVPIVVSGVFEIELNISGSVTGALTATETLRIGYQRLSYKMECRKFPLGECTPSDAKEPIATLTVNGNGEAEGQVVVKLVPKMRVSLYEAATAQVTLEASATVKAGVEGFVVLNTDFNPELEVPNIAFDADYRLTKASLNFGATAYLYADLTAFGKTWYAWPRGATMAAYETHYPVVLLDSTLAALPELSAVSDMSAVNPADLAAILVRASHSNWPNPLYNLIQGTPESFFPWRRWTAPKVKGPLAASPGSYGFVPDPSLPDGHYWVTFTEPGDYVVRVGGFSSWGSWARQYTEVVVTVTDLNGNGVLDHVEARGGGPEITVAGVSCSPPVVGAPMNCTVSGSNLPAAIVFNATNCSPQPMDVVAGGSGSSRSFTCTPLSPGVPVEVSYTVAGFVGLLPTVPTVPASEVPPVTSDVFAWPVDPENLSRGSLGPCNDQSGGCYWLSDTSRDPSTVWRDAQPFQQEEYVGFGWHLGADYNLGSGNSSGGNGDDYRKPVFAAADGWVAAVHRNACGYGNVVFVRHNTSSGAVITMYAHVDWFTTAVPNVGDPVSRGQAIAEIGEGAWFSPPCGTSGSYRGIEHLHFEVRESDDITLGRAYTTERLPEGTRGPQGQVDPNAFIRNRLPTVSTAQPGFTGHWFGTASSGNQRFSYRWWLTQAGDSVTGSVTIQSTTSHEALSYRISGAIVGSGFSFRGTEVISRIGSSFCMASGEVAMDLGGARPRLSGTWGPLNVPGGCPNGSGGAIEMVKADQPLNDTGSTADMCYGAGSNALVSCPSPEAIALNAQQDGMIGRDVTDPHPSDGKLGFSFSLVPRPVGGYFDKTECVVDNVTGLMWEGKTASGPRAGDYRYANFVSGATGHVSAYVAYVNSIALCGFSDWRLPEIEELLSLVDYGATLPLTIDRDWFPNVSGHYFFLYYWSSTPNVGVSGAVWTINFGLGYVSYDLSFSTARHRVRLVR
jgi:hypothetical protein